MATTFPLSSLLRRRTCWPLRMLLVGCSKTVLHILVFGAIGNLTVSWLTTHFEDRPLGAFQSGLSSDVVSAFDVSSTALVRLPWHSLLQHGYYLVPYSPSSRDRPAMLQGMALRDM
mmetsp:Transcript_43381/g.139438  ORF Transcript_43381/g.139438 Transcript_43381/m.139438 type:complete len:116 (-) Transcript_43381:149-496(-)